MKKMLIFTGIAFIFAALAVVMHAPAWMVWSAGGITTAAVVVSLVAFVLERRGGRE